MGVSVAGALLLQNQNTAISTTSASGKSGTATSEEINYQFGTIQLKVTEAAGEITAIDLVQAGANGGREQAFSYLVQDALSANGTDFANISGATYTVDAFKQALDSAISKIN
jgi:uncharacterized protein with FMN-binding domain